MLWKVRISSIVTSRTASTLGQQINEPQKWPISVVSADICIPRDEEYLVEIGDPFEPPDPLEPIITGVSDDNLTFVVEGNEEIPGIRPPLSYTVCSGPRTFLVNL